MDKRIYYIEMFINMLRHPKAGWTISKKEIIKRIVKGGNWNDKT